MKSILLSFVLFAVPLVAFAQDTTGAGMYLYYHDTKLFHTNTGIMANQSNYAISLYRDEALMLSNAINFPGYGAAKMDFSVNGTTAIQRFGVQEGLYQQGNMFAAVTGLYTHLKYDNGNFVLVRKPSEDGGGWDLYRPDSSEHLYLLDVETCYLVTSKFLLALNAGVIRQDFEGTHYPVQIGAGFLIRPVNFIQAKAEYVGYTEQYGSLRNKMYLGISLMSFFASFDLGYMFIKEKEGMGLKQGLAVAVAAYF